MTKEEKILTQRKTILAFMNYFENNQLDMNNAQILQNMQNSITRIFRLEVEELGYTCTLNNENVDNAFHLAFVNEPKETYRGRHTAGLKFENGKWIQSPPTVEYNTAVLYKGLTNSSGEERIKACKMLFKTVFHEIQHHRQFMMTRTSVSSKSGIEYARDFAVKQYLQKDWYSHSGKTGNYDAYITENNANEVGYEQLLEILGTDDIETKGLRDIERGRVNISRYRAAVDSWDGRQHYDSEGLRERSDVTIPILDNLICEKGRIEILQMYPILQKEYRLDGTKRSAAELIKNMKLEINKISQAPSLTAEDRKTLINDCEQMYYDLIYKQIEKCAPEQIEEIATQIGKTESKEIFDKMSYRFQCELENRLGKSARMASAQEDKNEYIMPVNSGTVAVEQNGQMVQMKFDEFIKTIDPQLLQKKFNIPSGRNKGEMPASQFIEQYFFNHLSESGMVTLKDGRKITAKDYIEQYVLQTLQISKENPPKKFIMDTIQSDDPWEVQKANCSRLEQYYNSKKSVIASVSKMVEQYNPTRQQVHGNINDQPTTGRVSPYNFGIIDPDAVFDSTLEVGIGIQDIDAVIEEIGLTQTKDKQINMEI